MTKGNSMKRIIAIAIAGMLFCDTAEAQVYSNPSSVGVASPGQIPGTTTNDNACAGCIGEYIFSSIPNGSVVNIPNNTATDITSISLTAGDWDVWGNITGFSATGTVMSSQQGWISATSATRPAAPNGGAFIFDSSATPASNNNFLPVGMMRISIATNTTVYLTTQVAFTVSTYTSGGFIGARRVR